MDFRTIAPDKSLSLFVKNIMVFEDQENTGKTVLPFFADGYTGLLVHESENGLFVRPQNKKMPLLFLYGLTIHPIELNLKGNYRLMMFQLYPFVLKSFFNISPQDLNDDCYDLQQQEQAKEIIQKLQIHLTAEKVIKIVSGYLLQLFKNKQFLLDYVIGQALKLIIEKNGQIAVNQLCAELSITPRTFQRRFLNEVGVSAKQFCQIIRFQESLQQVTLNDYHKLTDIVYSNGFADQSHFIRVFKAFTGKTPKRFTV